jgi:predicted GNAT family acetyltransferase
MTTTPADKTGASTTVSREPGRFTIAVDGRQVGFAEFTDAGGRRTFPHTVVDEAFQGRGLATILVATALQATRADGLRIVAPCSMVADYLEKSGAYDDLVDPV